MRYTHCLGASTLVISLLADAGASAKDMSVGGTSRSSKEPLMESLPPIAPKPSFICAYSAPSRADAGLPQRSGSVPSRSKNSCKVRRARRKSAPVAATLSTLMSTEYAAPTKRLSVSRSG